MQCKNYPNMIFSKDEVQKKSIPENILGVYYFLNENNDIIYIGKSINIKKRVHQHLANGRKRMLFSFKKVMIKKLHSELEALLYESQEIKKYKPIFNRKLRKIRNSISVSYKQNKYSYPFFYTHKTSSSSLFDFFSKKKALAFIDKITTQFNLCDKLNGLDKVNKACFKYQLNNCNGACVGKESIVDYQKRFDLCLAHLFDLPNDCKIIFTTNKIKTYVKIKKNQVTEFGVKGKSKHIIKYRSYDEFKIVSSFQKKIKSSKFIET
tara:strand:- start:134 stop:928 length:795 start_codon:yes stop_codon:yes gene_type:complete